MNSPEREDRIPGIEDIAQAYERAGFEEQPPPHVDRAILEEAGRRRARMPVFVPALALAATVVVSFSLVLRSGLLGIGGTDAPRDSSPNPRVMEQISSEPRADDGTAVPAASRALEEQPRLEENAALRSSAVENATLQCRASSGGVPAEWLACISQLLAAGEEQTAREELDGFLQNNPEYSLPENFEALREP